LSDVEAPTGRLANVREGAGDKQQLTPYRELDEVLIDYANTCRAVLGRNFVGLYLLGSLAIGDFDLTSDVDFMIVTKTELATDEVERVQAAHTVLLGRDSRWVRHLEYSIFSLAQLSKRPSAAGHDASPAPELWYFINGGSVIERSDHDNTLVTRWTLRYKGKAVLGPQPATFAPQVTADELRQEIRESMLKWEKLFTPESSFNNRFHQVFFVLNNCRALQDLHEGRITSKREGVAWAKKHLAARWHALIDYSWRERQDTEINVSQPVDPETFEETVGFIAYTTRLAENYELAED
jgi:predicted nucleotidyltransferase